MGMAGIFGVLFPGKGNPTLLVMTNPLWNLPDCTNAKILTVSNSLVFTVRTT